MAFERAVQAAIVQADMIACETFPVVVALLLFGVVAFLILWLWLK